ncbi:neural cell adhesion molecule 1 isoform X1 [Scleropages formosus]|uniref:neural cell adhesion molecule 1 isoform X1 n=1 Tax=Scleropages formosus TaxID=113540 RepID=UPI0010FA9A37|nr:neural cell adhesion molecule 1-like isoform X1 [Scleropages formosus]
MMLALCALFLAAAALTDAKMEIITNAQDFELKTQILLLCKAGAEGDITWQKDGEDVNEEHFKVEKVDETSSKLIIKSASLADSGRYKCICEYDTGHTDQVEINIYVYQKPTFSGTKTYHEFLVGQKANIPCIVTGLPAVDVKWQRNGHDITDDRVKVLNDNSLQILDIRREDRGAYVCEGKIRSRPISKTLTISVVVNALPEVKIHEKLKNVLAGPQNNVSLICLVSGEPTPNITWTSPLTSDTSRYIFNSDKSELTIPSVVRLDYGEYTCTATNKIGEASASLMLDVSVHPNVTLTKKVMEVQPGHPASVTCRAAGHPDPTTLWVKKGTNEELTSTTGRVKVEGSTLQIEKVVPSDGGLYTCIAQNSAGNDSKDFSLETWPDIPTNVTVTEGPSSVNFFLPTSLVDGGSPVTHYILQWKQKGDAKWSQNIIPSTEPVVITSLNPYTTYTVRIAVQNHIGQGRFSSEYSLRTLARQGEPDSPILAISESKIENNSFSLPFKKPEHGASPILRFVVRYRTEAADDDWREKRLPSNTSVIVLSDLQYNTSYLVEVIAANANGLSYPAFYNFTTPLLVIAKPVKSGLGKGGVVGIVMLIFLVLLIAVDATCCYMNNCGILMFLTVKLLGRKAVVTKGLEQGDAEISTVDMKLKGLSTPRGSIPKLHLPNGPKNGAQVEVTCDKAPLTKFEKLPPSTIPSADA